MPKQKKTSKRGRKPKVEEECVYSKLSEEEKTAYHRDKIRLHRGFTGPPSTSSSIKETSPSSSSKRPRGRPTIMGLVAMTPDTLRKRKSYLTSEKRKKHRRIKKAKAAAVKRLSSEFDDCDREENEESEDSNEDDQPDEEEIETMDEGSDDNQEIPTAQSRRTIFRAKCGLRGILTDNAFDNMLLLLAFGNTHQLPDGLSDQLSKLHSLKLDLRKHRYRILRLQDLFLKFSPTVETEVLKFWLENIFSSNGVIPLFESACVNIPENLLPKSFIVSRHAEIVAKRYLDVSSKSSHTVRNNSINYIIDTARECNLTVNDTQVLSSATNCSSKFAKRVLDAIANNSVNELLVLRRKRVDAIHVTEWPRMIADFVFRPENTRSVPGKETVSVRYGVRKPKYLLLKSRDEIAKAFKAEYPSCDYSLSVIKREFPPNAVTPTTRDQERNTCPHHANARRLIKCINKAFRKHGVAILPHSCRDICMTVMCQQEGVNASEPTTWKPNCATGKCKTCPVFRTECQAELLVKEVKFSLWESRKVNVTKTDKNNVTKTTEKYVFALYPYITTLGETIEKLKKMLTKLKTHIFTAHRQWSAHDHQRNNMDTSSIITIEDYQMNLTVEHNEAPTSCAYSSNKRTIAMYPLCVEFVREDGGLGKGGIIFLSEDKIHDHQQVEAFEVQAFEIFKEKLPHDISSWKRYSDGCGAQFWSRFVNANIFSMKDILKLDNISYDRFEAHEGKSISDTLGSIAKCCFKRAIFKNPEGVSSAADVVNLIRSELKDSSQKFDFLIAEEFGSIERKLERNELVIPNITKMHSITVLNDTVIASQFSCTECRVSGMCAECETGKAISKTKMKIADTNEDEQNADAEENQNEVLGDSEDEGQTDIEESDLSSDGEDEDEIQPGDIVWGLLGTIWYPGRICNLSEVPEEAQPHFKNIMNKYLVCWYGDNKISAIKRVVRLGETQDDAKKSSRSKYMQQLYNMALSELS